MRQLQYAFEVRTKGRGLHEITREVAQWVEKSGFCLGLLALFVRHTSASLLIQENADATVREDMEQLFARLVPDGDPLFRHRLEGPDDMAAHARSALTAASLSIPVREGALTLGTWQGVYLWEHRMAPQERQIVLHLVGD